MRHCVRGKQLSRNSAHRKALRRNLAIALLQHGAIRTTEPKAKHIRPWVEKLITLAKKSLAKGEKVAGMRLISAELGNRSGQRGELYKVVDGHDEQIEEKSILQKLFDEIAPRYADRPGGYTRIIRLSERRIGDAGQQVVLQLVESAGAAESASTGKRKKKAAPAESAEKPAE